MTLKERIKLIINLNFNIFTLQCLTIGRISFIYKKCWQYTLIVLYCILKFSCKICVLLGTGYMCTWNWRNVYCILPGTGDMCTCILPETGGMCTVFYLELEVCVLYSTWNWRNVYCILPGTGDMCTVFYLELEICVLYSTWN